MEKNKMNLQSLIDKLNQLKPKLYLSDEELLHKENYSPQKCNLAKDRAGKVTTPEIVLPEDDYLDYSTESSWLWIGSMSEKPRWTYEGGSL